MDSLTQIVLASSVAAISVPAAHRRVAILVGALLGTLPDLDNVYFKLVGSDAVTEITWHRGPSHSLWILGLVGFLLWYWAKKRSVRVRSAPRRWLLAICLALITHPILDAFTIYGTQLLWPIPMRPVMGASIYVIDPLYTLPLLLGVLLAYRFSANRAALRVDQAPRDRVAGRCLWIGLLLSSSYLAWSVLAKIQVERIAEQSLRPYGLHQAARFSTPTPINTLLWRVVVMDQDGYWIGDRSLLADHGPMQFRFYPSAQHLLSEQLNSAQLQRLLWFCHGFVGVAEQKTKHAAAQLIVSDLRMGFEPDYFFRYQIAQRDAQGEWLPLQDIQLLDIKENRFRGLSWMWRRIFQSELDLEH